MVAATDYLETFAEQIRPFVERRFVALGTNGFGRSDSREALRDFFEVDARYITLAVLYSLAREGDIPVLADYFGRRMAAERVRLRC